MKKHKKHKKSKRKIAEPECYTPERKETAIVNGDNRSEEKMIDDVKAAVDIISEGLRDKKMSLEVISSESDDVPEADCDSIDIDMNVIEADMDLEELMKQKELLQAQLARAESEDIREPETKNGRGGDEVILLDDSDEADATQVSKKRSRSIERRVQVRPKDDIKRRRTDSRDRSYKDHERER